MKVAIQGIHGAFHEEAAALFFGEEMEIAPYMRFDILVNAVDSEAVDYGVIAVENTISGTLNQNLLLIANSEVSIIGEVSLRIEQNLGALPGQDVEGLKEVMSHHMALHQCRKFFDSYSHIKLVEIEDTALAAKRIADKQLQGVGAVASARAMHHYGLEILATGIETNHTNHTRFFIITANSRSRSSSVPDKCTLMFTIPSKPGSLHEILGVFVKAGIDLTKIESIPIEGQPYHYAFIVDCTFTETSQIRNVLPWLESATESVKVLGMYNASELKI